MGNVIVVIPARYASVRFPGKVLANRSGKYLIQHVYEQAEKARSVAKVIVAAEDPRTIDAIESFGGNVAMTDSELPNGTCRCAAVAEGLSADDIIVNVQGDEPEIDPGCIDQVAELLLESDAAMATLGTPFGADDDPADPNCVKVIFNKFNDAIYFSRALIPFPRDGIKSLPGDFSYLLHLGIYAYRRDFLLEYASLPASPLEEIEKLEQLRAIWHGHRIKVGVTSHRSIGVDTPEEYKAFVDRHLYMQSRKT